VRSPITAAVVLLLAVTTACAAPDASGTPGGASMHESPRATVRADTSTDASSAPATEGPPPASASPSPVLTGDDLAAALTVDGIQAHLDALQAIADGAGGTRATGTRGYLASVRHVTDALLTSGYAPELEPFTSGGVTGTNVLAERPGSETQGVVVIGAHLDSVPVGPGINDNGSGVAVLLALADALATLPQPGHTIRFAFWDAEEGGPFGSAAHVDALSVEERDRVVAYLNLDMVGSTNPVRFVYAEAGAAPGSDLLTDAFAAAFEQAGIAWDPIDVEGDSDHGPFAAAGIPTGGVFSGGREIVTEDQAGRHGAVSGVPADPCSHAPCDTIANVDAATALSMARAVALVLAEIAATP
jgi:aminopeptidase S